MITPLSRQYLSKPSLVLLCRPYLVHGCIRNSRLLQHFTLTSSINARPFMTSGSDSLPSWSIQEQPCEKCAATVKEYTRHILVYSNVPSTQWPSKVELMPTVNDLSRKIGTLSPHISLSSYFLVTFNQSIERDLKVFKI